MPKTQFSIALEEQPCSVVKMDEAWAGPPNVISASFRAMRTQPLQVKH